MRERFDFCSVTKIILGNRIAGNMTATSYFCRVFDYALSQDQIKIKEPQETDMRKIVNGRLPVPKNIVGIYQDEDNFEYLKEDVSYLLADIFDLPTVIKQLYDLLMVDDSLSWEMRQEIAALKEDAAHFIAECIRTGVLRGSGTKGDGAGKIALSDYLEDYHYPKSSKVFFGRDSEVSAIHERLEEDSCLFLQGIGGIGKSELAKYYGNQYKNEYDHVLYLHYEEDLYQTICQLGFIDDTPEMNERALFESHYRLFKRLGSNALVILDGFNRLPEEDERLQEFAELSFRLLVTTRSRTDDYSCYPVKEITSMDALQQIFFAYMPAGKQKPDVISQIIETVYRHTLTVEMAAKTMKAADLEAEELLAALQNDHLYLSSPNKVRVQKDARIKTATPKDHLARLFQLQQLSDQNQATLQHLRLMPESGIPKRLFRKWMEMKDLNAINTLIDYGWIQEDVNTNCISIHPFLHEVLGIFDMPSIKKCQTFITSLGEAYKEDGNEYLDLLGISRSIFKTLEIDDMALGFDFFEQILSYLEKHMYYRAMSEVLDKQRELLPLDAVHSLEAAAYQYRRGQIAWWFEKLEVCTNQFEIGVDFLTPPDESNFNLLIAIQTRLSFCYLLALRYDKYFECTKNVVELREQFGSSSLLDDETERMNLRIATAINETESGTFDMDALFETPEFQKFRQSTQELSAETISKDEILADFEKVVPDELPDAVGFLFQGMKEEIQLSMSDKEDNFTFTDYMIGLIESAANLSEKYQEKIRQLIT